MCKVSGIFYICRRFATYQGRNEMKIQHITYTYVYVTYRDALLDGDLDSDSDSGRWNGMGVETLKSVGVSICMHRGNKSRNNIYTFVLCCICHVTIKDSTPISRRPIATQSKLHLLFHPSKHVNTH